MEASMSSIAVAIVVITLVTWLLNLVWWRPKRLERSLRKQGLKGNSYRLFHGDLKESSSMISQATSTPLSLSDDHSRRVLPFEIQNIDKYGRDSFTWFGRWPRVNIMDPEQIKEVFLKYDEFHKATSVNPLFSLVTTGTLNLEGEKWARYRKIVNPAFQTERLKLMVPAMYATCADMINRWENMVSDKGSCELDVLPSLFVLTRDFISRSIFSSNYERGTSIFRYQKELVDFFVRIMREPYTPGLRFIPTKMNRRMKEIHRTVDPVLEAIISEREKAIKAGGAKNDDILDKMLETNMKEIRDHKNKNAAMSLAGVIEECKLLYFGGQESTMVLLIWTMLLLCEHPTWQDRAREEVLQVLGNKKPDYESLNHLKIVTMILNEVLRLYPPFPVVNRTVHKEVKLGNLTLPAGVQIGIPILLLHKDPNIWGDDANEFKPERFAEGISKATKNRVTYIPFGWGRRICVGQNFSLIESKLALAMILQHFWFEQSPSYKHSPVNVLTLQPQHGCQIILHKR